MPICGRFTHSVNSSVCLRLYSLQHSGTANSDTPFLHYQKHQSRAPCDQGILHDAFYLYES